MKYIKLFEAFDSSVLSKTLKYVNNKEQFLQILKGVCDKIDFPESKLTDDLFQYLPYKSALNYKTEKGTPGTEEDCKANSKEVFGDNGVDHPHLYKNCRAGVIARKWGRGTRLVSCPICKGTGKTGEKGTTGEKQPQNTYKFWFDEKGNYITTTNVHIEGEGVTKRTAPIKKFIWSRSIVERELSSIINNDTKLSGYEIVASVRDLNRSALHPLRGLYLPGIAYFSRAEYERGISTPGYFLYRGSGYFIHTNYNKNGSSPDGNEWREYGQYAWSLGGNDTYFVAFSTDPKISGSGVETEVKSAGTSPITDINKTLAEAKFAIILDTEKLSTEVKKSEIKGGRKEAKTGVIGGKIGISDEVIKKQNMDRYLSKLTDVGDKLEIGNFNNYFFRILGYSNILFKILGHGSDPRYRLSVKLDDILNKNIKLVKAVDKAKKKRGAYVAPSAEIKLVSDLLKSYFTKELSSNSDVVNNIKRLKDEMRVNGDRVEKQEFLLTQLEELSRTIYNKLRSFGELESIDDAELLVQKIKTIENLIWNKRYDFSNFRLSNVRSILFVSLATKSTADIKKICDQLKNVIEKV